MYLKKSHKLRFEIGSRTKSEKVRKAWHNRQEEQGQTPNNIWKNGTFIMSLLSCQIFFHWKESPEVGILIVFIIITCLFKKNKQKDTFSDHETSYQLYITSLWFTSHSPWHNFLEFHGGGDEPIFFFYSVKAESENICTRKIIHYHSHRLPLRETDKEERENSFVVIRAL